ncbi:ZIP zinc transporter-domain-containing protein [Gigaspora rosea]|uniref:ZIP zinc transporter-domain-containing protein n=1 Tax=Gigaspora rosea TaxID=44941 RepID=A0A397UQ38_9GLOM|nr:ZIP zinc transporter-domain-containing protein [Gigaspora rosea]
MARKNVLFGLSSILCNTKSEGTFPLGSIRIFYLAIYEPIDTISTKSQENQIEYNYHQASEHCPFIQELNKQKKASLNIENNLTKQIFAFLFPGSPRVNSILGTFYISSIPNFILYFVPPDIKPSSLNSLVSFAVGGLLGDVFLHLLPHSFLGENTDEEVHFVQVEEKKNVIIGLAIFVGLTTFYVIDKLMRVANGGEGGHSHNHEQDICNDKDIGSSTSHDLSGNDLSSSTLRQRKSTDDKTMDEKPATKAPSTSIKLSAYLNLFADFTHNVTDGLAMAASFYTSPSIGATTTVAVFFHEIPHEIGDYAILIQSGFTKQRAMLSQFITAIGAFLGTFIGIAIEEFSRGDQRHTTEILSEGYGIWGTGVVLGDLVIPFTAGGFLYIATVGVIPELLEVTGNFVKDLKQSCTEFLAMFIGVGMMAIIAWNEGS